jgi:hypothetical protein
MKGMQRVLHHLSLQKMQQVYFNNDWCNHIRMEYFARTSQITFKFLVISLGFHQL